MVAHLELDFIIMGYLLLVLKSSFLLFTLNILNITRATCLAGTGALPVCRYSAWTSVLCPLVSSCIKTPSVAGHRATGTPEGSRPAPSALHIPGGRGLLCSDMKHSGVYTQNNDTYITRHHTGITLH